MIKPKQRSRSAVCRGWPSGTDEAGRKGAEMKKCIKRSRCLREKHRLHKKLNNSTVSQVDVIVKREW